MSLESLVVTLLVGLIAGWLAAKIVNRGGYGLLGNMVVGVVGAFVASLVFPALGLTIGTGIVSAILHATLGAIILLVLLRLLRLG